MLEFFLSNSSQKLKTSVFSLIEHIKGFEDGLNEGLGSWFGKTLGKTVNFFKSIPDKAKDWYQKGKEYAGKAWDWIKDLSKRIADSVKNGFETAKNWVTTNFQKFTEWISKTYSSAVEGIKSAWQKFKGKISDFSDWCVDMWSRLIDNVKSLVKSTRDKFKNLGSKMSEWVSENWQKLKAYAEKAKNSTVEAFRTLGEKVSSAIGSGLKKAGQISLAILLVCAWPFNKLLELIKKVPSLFQKLVKIVSDYIKSEIEDFKIAYGEEMERYRREKEDKNKPPVPPINDGPEGDLSLPEIQDEEEMSDEEAKSRLEEIRRELKTENKNYFGGFQYNKIKKFRNF